MDIEELRLRTRNYQKKSLHKFWKSKWIPGRSPQHWLDIISNDRSGKDYDGTFVYRNPWYGKQLILTALRKLTLEHRITEEQEERLLTMLKSTDKDNVYIALSVMASVAPTRFRRRKDIEV